MSNHRLASPSTNYKIKSVMINLETKRVKIINHCMAIIGTEVGRVEMLIHLHH